MARARSLYFGVGVLILSGAALAVGFVLFLTSGRLGRDQQIFETYVRESVTGLDVGAPVRFRGVSVGRVTEIGLVAIDYPIPNATPSMTEFRLVIIRFAVREQYLIYPNMIQSAVGNGLRARLSTQGITGVSYLELDFVDEDRFPVATIPWTPRYPVIPSVPSTVAQVTNAAERIVERLDNIDIEALLGNINGLVTDIRGVVRSDELTGTLREAAEAMTALRGAVREADIAAVLTEIRDAAQNVSSFANAATALANSPDIGNILTSANRVATDLRAAITRLPQAIQSLETTIRAARTVTTDTQADLVPLLRDLRATAANLRDVTEALRRSPSQALWGAPPPQPDRR